MGARLSGAIVYLRNSFVVEVLVDVEVVDGVEVVCRLLVRCRRGVWATLIRSVANCIVYVRKQEKLAKHVPERQSSLLLLGALSQARSRRDVGEGS